MPDSPIEDPGTARDTATRRHAPAGAAPLGRAAVASRTRAGHLEAATDGAPPVTSGSGSDARAAWRLVTVSLGVAALVAGLLEYVGLGIAARYGSVPEGAAFWRAWGTGAFSTLGGAIGAGAAGAGVAALGWRRWRRPVRALAAGFALGAVTLLGALSLLTAWAP